MEHFIFVFHTLVYVVINTVLCQFFNKAVNSGVTYDVNQTRITICTHNRVNIAHNFGCHLRWNLNNVCSEIVIQLVFQYLGFSCLQRCNGCLVQRICKRSANLFHFAVEIVVIRNFVVHIQRWHHCKTDGICRPNHGIKCGRVFIVRDNTRTNVANRNVAIVIDNRNLYRISD